MAACESYTASHVATTHRAGDDQRNPPAKPDYIHMCAVKAAGSELVEVIFVRTREAYSTQVFLPYLELVNGF